jgi:hypothetical protein
VPSKQTATAPLAVSKEVSTWVETGTDELIGAVELTGLVVTVWLVSAVVLEAVADEVAVEVFLAGVLLAGLVVAGAFVPQERDSTRAIIKQALINLVRIFIVSSRLPLKSTFYGIESCC